MERLGIKVDVFGVYSATNMLLCDTNSPARVFRVGPAEYLKNIQLIVEAYSCNHALRSRTLQSGHILLDIKLDSGVCVRLEPTVDFPALRKAFRAYGIRVEGLFIGTPMQAMHEAELQNLYELLKAECKLLVAANPQQ